MNIEQIKKIILKEMPAEKEIDSLSNNSEVYWYLTGKYNVCFDILQKIASSEEYKNISNNPHDPTDIPCG